MSASGFLALAIALYSPVDQGSILHSLVAGVAAGTVAWSAGGIWRLGGRMPDLPPRGNAGSRACLRAGIATGLIVAAAMLAGVVLSG